MNALLNFFKGGNGVAVLFQAVMTAMRNGSPKDFIKGLAESEPRLKNINLDDLMGSAQQLAKERGIDIESVQKQLDSTIGSMMK